MKVAALTMLLATMMTRVGTGVAAPLADLAAVAVRPAHMTEGFEAARLKARPTEGFGLRDGVRYNLGRRVGLFVDYKELRPACGALSSLDAGLPAKPPVRLGSFVVSAGLRFYFN